MKMLLCLITDMRYFKFRACDCLNFRKDLTKFFDWRRAIFHIRFSDIFFCEREEEDIRYQIFSNCARYPSIQVMRPRFIVAFIGINLNKHFVSKTSVHCRFQRYKLYITNLLPPRQLPFPISVT